MAESIREAAERAARKFWTDRDASDGFKAWEKDTAMMAAEIEQIATAAVEAAIESERRAHAEIAIAEASCAIAAAVEAERERIMQILEARKQRHGKGCDCGGFETVCALLTEIGARGAR